jgi:hypothetical protein
MIRLVLSASQRGLNGLTHVRVEPARGEEAMVLRYAELGWSPRAAGAGCASLTGIGLRRGCLSGARQPLRSIPREAGA